MISALYSHNSATINHKKSLPKKSQSIGHQFQFKGGGQSQSSRQKVTSTKHINQINMQQKGLLAYNFKSKQLLPNNKTNIKSRSCQNSTQKLSSTRNPHKTVYIGSSTQRSHNSTQLRRNKKEFEKIDYEMIGTEGRKAAKEKNFFYEGKMTDNTLKWVSKETRNQKRTGSQERERTPLSTNQKQKWALSPQQWNSALIPFKWKEVLQRYSHLLTKFQQQQIKQYKNIYYIGHKLTPKQKQLSQSVTTKSSESTPEVIPSFDNNENQYMYALNDHVAYRYEILQKMGKGSYGEVIKAFDHKKKQHVALKIVRNKTKFNQQAFIEIQLLTHIKEVDTDNSSNVVRIKDFIIFRKHVCIVFQLLSQNLYQLIVRNNYSGLSPDLIRRFAIQILTALIFLRKQNIIHCDLKPQNILLRQFNKSGIKIIDLGSSCFKNQTKYTYIQSRYYRAPQITLGVKYCVQIDMWSAGCIFAQLWTGIPLFPGQNQLEQMKYFIKTLGLPPKYVATHGDRCQIFFDQEGHARDSVLNAKSIDHFQNPLKDRFNDPDFYDFIEGFLRWDPKERFTPIQAMNHKWIREGLPPQINRILPQQGPQKSGSRSQSRKNNVKSHQKGARPNQITTPDKQGIDSNIRIKKSYKHLSHRSKQFQRTGKN